MSLHLDQHKQGSGWRTNCRGLQQDKSYKIQTQLNISSLCGLTYLLIGLLFILALSTVSIPLCSCPSHALPAPSVSSPLQSPGLSFPSYHAPSFFALPV